MIYFEFIFKHILQRKAGLKNKCYFSKFGNIQANELNKKQGKKIEYENIEIEEKLSASDKKIPSSSKQSHAEKIKNYFSKRRHLNDIKKKIPQKYLLLKRITPPDNIYLIDPEIAKKAVSQILQRINANNTLLCETNAGLGLITKELLDNNIKMVRMYESCPDFKLILKDLLYDYNGRFELFTKDVFLVPRYDYMDKQDHGYRVEQLLSGIPKKDWLDDPALTIIGAMPNTYFIHYLIKSLVLQSFITQFGRIELFTFIRPRDYVVLTAGPHLNLHTYQHISVLSQLFFNIELIDKFPNEVFLPWLSKKKSRNIRYADRFDPDMRYFVKISFKKQLPVSSEYLLPLYIFVKQFYGRGRTKVISTLEKWVPGAGLEVFVPKFAHKNYFEDMNIYTQFGELTPEQILYIFEEMISHSGYSKSPFMAMIENNLIKTETIESTLDDQLEKNIVDEITDKLNK